MIVNDLRYELSQKETDFTTTDSLYEYAWKTANLIEHCDKKGLFNGGDSTELRG